VIPAYREETRLPESLRRIAAFLGAEPGLERAEVLVVDDGSPDRTGDVAREEGRRLGLALTVLRLPENRGKGCAVRNGVLAAAGESILVTDADLSTPIEEWRKLAGAGVPVAIGSRAVDESTVKVRQSFYRVAVGRLFNALVRLLVVPGIADTQCGFKLFSREAALEIFPRLVVDRFAWDVEALGVARKIGYEVAEVPVLWFNSADSRVTPRRTSTSSGSRSASPGPSRRRAETAGAAPTAAPFPGRRDRSLVGVPDVPVECVAGPVPVGRPVGDARPVGGEGDPVAPPLRLAEEDDRVAADRLEDQLVPLLLAVVVPPDRPEPVAVALPGPHALPAPFVHFPDPAPPVVVVRPMASTSAAAPFDAGAGDVGAGEPHVAAVPPRDAELVDVGERDPHLAAVVRGDHEAAATRPPPLGGRRSRAHECQRDEQS
jgi:dolichyl-phosphate beta-glucosyltransferase